MKTIVLAVLLVILLVQPVLAFAGEPPATFAQPTPAPAKPAAQSGGFPWLALLVFLVPLGIVLFRSRGKKAPDIRGGSCLPVIDEKARPFAPGDDDEDN